MSRPKHKPEAKAETVAAVQTVVTETLEVEAKAETEVVVKPVGIVVVNVNSPMPHLLKGVTINGPTEFECMDSFLQSQIDAGKLKLL